MDCRHFSKRLSGEYREFLVWLLRRYDPKLMVDGWVKLGQIKIPSVKDVDYQKAKAVQILLKSKGLCKKQNTYVFPVEQCSLWQALISSILFFVSCKFAK